MKLSPQSFVATLAASAVSVGALPVLEQMPLLPDLFAPSELPLVNSSLLQASIDADNLRSRAEVLFKLAQTSEKEYGHPTRVIGSSGHWATVNYVLDELHKMKGFYDVGLQYFDAIQGKVHDYSLLVDGTAPKSVRPMSLSPPTEGAVTAPLVAVGSFGCEPSDFPSNVTGAVALIKRGECSFGQKSVLAHRSGAAAVLIYNNEDGALAGTLEPSDESAPSLSVSLADGAAYAAALAAGKVLIATVYIDSEVNRIRTANVIAQSRTGDQDNVVMAGAHSDSVEAGPGINDDGSGSISLLEVASQLTNYQLNNSVRFAWWSAEEEGLLGSTHYAESLSPAENSKIRMFMDYDMMASPNYAYQVYDANNVDNPVGSEELKNLYVDWYLSQGLNYSLIPFDGRSDYVGFIDADIPGGGIATGAEGIKSAKDQQLFGGVKDQPFDWCYHELCDDLTNLDYDAFLVNTKLIAHSVATYALSLDGFPERAVAGAATKTAAGKPARPFRGPHLIL